MTIQELYCDDKFNNILYFLNECGFFSLEDLKAFDFDELLFVPGVSENITEEAKRLYFDCQKTQKQEPSCEAQTKEVPLTPGTTTIESVPPSVNFSREDELQNSLLQCIDSLQSIFQGVSNVDQITGLRAFIGGMGAVEAVDKSVLFCLCDSLKEYFQREPAKKSQSATYSAEEDVDPTKQFVEIYNALKDNARNCLLLKAQGRTLQEIGEGIGVTRERVRQIIAKTVRKLNFVSAPILKKLMQDRGYFYKCDIKKLFSAPEYLDCFVYVLENTETVHYFEFADKFVDPALIPDNWGTLLHAMMQELIGDARNYYDILEEVEAELAKNGMSFLDASDFMGYLFEIGYIAIGDYITKKRGAYKRICYDAIMRHFKNGIKLDSDDKNQDMLRMREIIFKEYAGYTLPDSNRAITARVSPELILCGRGRYCAPENTILDENLFAQIVEYINNSEETSLYYSEIFAAFSGRLLAETSVDNANYLHGALKYLYPDDFEYERDLLVKHGMSRVTFGERLADSIKNNGGPITKKELQRQFPGVTDIRIMNAIASDPKLIQWDYNELNHIDNIHYTDLDVEQLRIILDELLGAQDGYSSENNFYNATRKKYPEFLEKNRIESSLNLFYIAAYLFDGDYRFSRPHIASKEFPEMELTNINVVRFFVADRPELYYQELVRISQRAGWSNGTFTIILNAIEEDYIKVDRNRYIHRSLFSVASNAIEAIKLQLQNLVRDSGYYGIFAIFNYEGFPEIDYEWNEYLLQSIIENYDIGFRLLEPKEKDRRYKKGIIVPMDDPCQSYEDFVIAQMKADGITSIAKDAFSGYLRRKGLVLTATIPFELYNGDGLRLEGNYFVFR